MNKIPLSVSSSLTNVASPSLLAVTPYANMTGRSGSAAPVLVAVESAGTVDAEAFAAALPARGGQGTAAQARLVVNALAAVLEDYASQYGAFSVNTPLGLIQTFIAGSLENATDAIDPEVNTPFIGIVPNADVMKTFAKMETYVPTGACPASLKRVRDVATGDHALHGANPFYAQGYGMTYGGAGETVKLLDETTRALVCDVAVDAATKSESQLKCTLQAGEATIPAGTYLLQVTTLAGGASTLWPLELRVRLAETLAPAPVPRPPMISRVFSQQGDNTITIGESYTIEGENLENATVAFYNASDEVLMSEAPMFTDGHLVGPAPQINDPQSGRVEVTNPDGFTSQTVTYVLH